MANKKKKKESLSERTTKNSIYNLIGTLISKFGGVAFIIILARFLLPEAFGIYNLVLSVIMIFITFTSLGIGGTIVRYMSEALGKGKRKKARGYFRYLLKFQGILLALVVLILVVFSKFISNTVFQKPEMFLPLIFASIYVLTRPLFVNSKNLFQSLNNFRNVSWILFVFYSSRIVLVFLAFYLATSSFMVSSVFLTMAISSILCGFIGFLLLGKNRDLVLGPTEKINKKRILSYLGYASLITISLTFFGSIDTLMLGRFVEAEFIGYYGAAFNLIANASGLFAFGMVLLPTLTRISGKKFKRGFQKSFRYIILLTIPSFFGLLIIGRYFIYTIYGPEYFLSAAPLYALSLLVIITPLIGLYSVLLKSREKPKALFNSVIFSLILNIVLNYLLIRYFLMFSHHLAILGAAIATVLSRIFYLFMITRKTNDILGLKAEKKPVLKSLVASLIMTAFLLAFIKFIDINLILGILAIILSAAIYFISLWLIKGVDKEDFDLFYNIFAKKFRV